MGIYKPKYATSEQVATIEQLIADGHQDALIAFGKDCVHEYDKSLTRVCLIAAGIGFVIGVADGVVKSVREKRKQKEKTLKKLNETLESKRDTSQDGGS